MSNQSHVRVFRAVRCAAGLAVALGIAVAGTDTAVVMAHAEHGHPAAVHEGGCDQLGRLAYRLNGVGGSVDLDNAPVATPTAVNPATSFQVMVSETTVDAPLADLLASDHAVMVYESDEEMTGIACGNIGGAMVGDALITGLAEMGVPGHSGFAIFTPDGDRTQVEVIIGHGLATVSGPGTEADHHDEATAGHDEEHAEDDAEGAATPTP
jgi:hypothetical protein